MNTGTIYFISYPMEPYFNFFLLIHCFTFMLFFRVSHILAKIFNLFFRWIKGSAFRMLLKILIMFLDYNENYFESYFINMVVYIQFDGNVISFRVLLCLQVFIFLDFYLFRKHLLDL